MILKKIESWEEPYENFFLKQEFVKPYSGAFAPLDSLKGLRRDCMECLGQVGMKQIAFGVYIPQIGCPLEFQQR